MNALNPEEPSKTKCTICIEEAVIKCRPDSCAHVFCFDCLVEWSNVTNICPLCKCQYKQVIKYEGDTVLEKIDVSPKKQEWEPGETDYLPDFADVCYECGDDKDEHAQIVCDACDYKVCHYYCCGFKELPPEQDSWFCKFCLEKDRLLEEQERKEKKLKVVLSSEEKKRRRRKQRMLKEVRAWRIQ